MSKGKSPVTKVPRRGPNPSAVKGRSKWGGRAPETAQERRDRIRKIREGK